MKSIASISSLVFFFVALFTASASAATIMVLSDSAGIYLIDTTTGAVVQSYGSLFTGSTAQDLGQDLNGNLFVTDGSGTLLKSALNPNAPNASSAYPATPATVGTITGLGAAVPRLGFDPTTLYCASGCFVTMNAAGSQLLWVDPSTAAVVKTLATSTAVGGGGDLAVVPSGPASETVYIISAKVLESVNATSGVVTTVGTITGPSANLTGLAAIPNGDLVACEQKGSGMPWTLWEFTTAGAAVTSHTNISTGSDVVNDLASVPATFVTSKTGTSAAGPNDSMFYTVALDNTGFFTAPTASIKDPIPATVTISTTTPPKCSVTGGAGTCTITSVVGAQTVVAEATGLAAGATATLTVTGMPNVASGSATNTANASVPFDPNEYGGQTLATNTVTTTFTASEMSKTVKNVTTGAGPGTNIPGSPGNILLYTLTFTNLRGFALRNFTINDPVPIGTTYVASSAACVSAGGLTCTPSEAANTVTYAFTGGSLAASASVTVTFEVKIN
ncbi:MAG: hypothetical protein M3R51_09350 [Candidatus Eremiobacteraeota bacterium]|nr:hypothetical protein [Candidatus Eremiobacteraeota bacterium]